jgi:hypothetical protein
MDGYKLASVAGMITMAASVFVEHTAPCLVQVGQTGQPGATGGARENAQSPTQPEKKLGGAIDQPVHTFTGPLFVLRDQSQEKKLTEFGQELARLEAKMKESNERLLKQLAQVRLLDGEKKVDALSDVVMMIVQDHVELENYLTRMREAVTGRVSGAIHAIPELDARDEFEHKKDMEDGEDKDDDAPLPDIPKDPTDPG